MQGTCQATSSTIPDPGETQQCNAHQWWLKYWKKVSIPYCRNALSQVQVQVWCQRHWHQNIIKVPKEKSTHYEEGRISQDFKTHKKPLKIQQCNGTIPDLSCSEVHSEMPPEPVWLLWCITQSTVELSLMMDWAHLNWLRAYTVSNMYLNELITLA